VTDVAATVSGSSVNFTWDDPGLAAGDQYQIATSDGGSSIQRSPAFTVDAEPGDRVCITVTVNREGRTGSPSAEKCADTIPEHNFGMNNLRFKMICRLLV
jgi:hypothetical protein